MTTSDTPETDKATIASGGDWSPVLRETCRRLERERNEWAAMCGRYKQERDEARVLLRILAGLVAYGLGQSGEEWSLEAMRQATNAIQNAKFLEEAK